MEFPNIKEMKEMKEMKEIKEIKEINKTVLTTVTNHGYLLYTLNMLKSLSLWHLDKTVLILCLDDKSFDILNKKGYCVALYNQKINNFCMWNTKGYDVICHIKLKWISHLLLNHNVVLMDGDIVFLQNPMLDIQQWDSETNEVYIQNDGQEDYDRRNLCTGYLYIRATDNMRNLYEYKSDTAIKQYESCAFINNDQSYFNDFIKPHCSVTALPLAQYPNGKYFYDHPDINSVLIHFNWVKGHFKMAKMKEYHKWLLMPSEERF